MTTIAIVYHSGRGHTRRVAESVLAGSSGVADTEARLVPVAEAAAHEAFIDAADAIVFGAPTYMGSLSAEMKAFMDATSRRVYVGQRWKDKLAAGFTNSSGWSGDKVFSLLQLVMFASQHSMLWVPLGLLAGNNSSHGSAEDLNRCGVWLGAAAQSHIDVPAETMPTGSDLRTAEHLGRRVAELARRFVPAPA